MFFQELDWDDSELISTWDLALEEYNKYYSIDPTKRVQGYSSEQEEGQVESEVESEEVEEHGNHLINDFINITGSSICDCCDLPKANDFVQSCFEYYSCGINDGLNDFDKKEDVGDALIDAWYNCGYQTAIAQRERC